MKNSIIIFLLLTSSFIHAQTYISGSFSYYNGTGTFNEKAMGTLEVGRTIKDILSLGIAVGKTSFSAGDTYIEFRPSLTVWSKNNLSLSGTLGAGYIFNTPQSFLTEYCATMTYSLSSNFSLCIFTGGYKFDGKSSSNSYTFVGTGISFIFNKKT